MVREAKERAAQALSAPVVLPDKRRRTGMSQQPSGARTTSIKRKSTAPKMSEVCLFFISFGMVNGRAPNSSNFKMYKVKLLATLGERP